MYINNKDNNIKDKKSRSYFRLYTSTKNKESFINIVRPYILPIFYYKPGL